jgi:hypothetical protein
VYHHHAFPLILHAQKRKKTAKSSDDRLVSLLYFTVFFLKKAARKHVDEIEPWYELVPSKA